MIKDVVRDRDIDSFIKVLRILKRDMYVKQHSCGYCPANETCIILFGTDDKPLTNEHGIDCFHLLLEDDIRTIESELREMVEEGTHEQ